MKKIILLSLLFLSLSFTNSFATTITKYVDTVAGSNTGGSSGGTGTGASAYATLAYAITQNAQNLVTNTSNLIINCAGNGTADTSAVSITGYTTSSTYNISIVGNATSGVYDTTKYVLKVEPGNAITVGAGNVSISHLQIARATTATGDGYGITDTGGSDVTLTFFDNIIRMASSNGGSYHNTAISMNVLGDGSLIYNNAIYSYVGGTGIYPAANHSYYNVYIYNNTLYGASGTTGISLGSGNGTYTVKNNISNNNSTDYSGTFNTHATNISKDSTSPDGSSYQTTNGTATFVSTTTGSENFNLSASDTSAIGRGTSLSGTFTTDITGATRTTWDIGAFYYAAAAPSVISTINNATINNATIN